MAAKNKNTIKKIDKKAEKGEASQQKKPGKDKSGVVIGYIIAIGIIITIIILVMGIMKSSNNFTVENIRFTKTNLGNLQFYKANFPLVGGSDLSGFMIVEYKEVSFRNDPRLTGNIPLNLSFGLNIVREGKVYVSADPSMEPACSDNGIAMIDLGRFFTIAGYDVKGATDDPAYQNSNSTPYVTCETHPKNTVIIVKGGRQTRVDQTAKNCYEISYKNCEITMASERLELEIFKDWMNVVGNLTAGNPAS